MNNASPTYDVDLYSDEVHLNPFPHFKKLRDIGAAVWLPRHEAWAIPRYKEVKECLRNADVFISGQGIALNDRFNTIMRGNAVTSDGELHTKLRKIMGKPMLPGALSAITERVQTTADALSEQLVARRSFDGVTDLAHHLPMSLVTEFVGLSDEGCDHMLEWAAAAFDSIGPMNDRAHAAQDRISEMAAYIDHCVATRAVRPGSWGDDIFQAVDSGEISPEKAGHLLMDYIIPSLDSTINVTSTLILHFARSPEQYELVRNDPSLIRNAINEAVRIDSPLRQFSRLVVRDVEVDGITLKANSRALVMFSSANHDERKFQDPERFDVRRNVGDHLGFGHGVHQCAGMHLAQLEIGCLLKALIPKIQRFELVGEPRYSVNNVLRGLSSLPVTVH
ncbi:cytochrome P450 [Paraburkholderia sp. GAS334]|uniref:cytochrome P450 n=1 Tax=Paraburkholderia sp. GAS334 TaxID=3035131 RepID=UPI003D198C41